MSEALEAAAAELRELLDTRDRIDALKAAILADQQPGAVIEVGGAPAFKVTAGARRFNPVKSSPPRSPRPSTATTPPTVTGEWLIWAAVLLAMSPPLAAAVFLLWGQIDEDREYKPKPKRKDHCND